MKEFIRNHFEEFVKMSQAAAGILRNRDLEDRQPADRGALGLPGKPPTVEPLELAARREIPQ